MRTRIYLLVGCWILCVVSIGCERSGSPPPNPLAFFTRGNESQAKASSLDSGNQTPLMFPPIGGVSYQPQVHSPDPNLDWRDYSRNLHKEHEPRIRQMGQQFSPQSQPPVAMTPMPPTYPQSGPNGGPSGPMIRWENKHHELGRWKVIFPPGTHSDRLSQVNLNGERYQRYAYGSDTVAAKFWVSFVDYPASLLQSRDRKGLLNEILNSTLKNLGGDLLNSFDWASDGNSGRGMTFRLRSEGGFGKMTAIFSGNRLYELIAFQSSASPENAQTINRFIDSFEILSGNRSSEEGTPLFVPNRPIGSSDSPVSSSPDGGTPSKPRLKDDPSLSPTPSKPLPDEDLGIPKPDFPEIPKLPKINLPSDGGKKSEPERKGFDGGFPTPPIPPPPPAPMK